MFYRNYVKRPIDFLLSLIALTLLLPFFVLIGILIKLDSKGPLFFKQLRLGKDEKEFYVYKFRTMRVDTPKNMPTYLLEDPDYHITKVGKFLRKSSLDELPQIINIVKGEMSIIGPRPIIKDEKELYYERVKNNVYSVLPGLTGFAQINGRDTIGYKEKARLDGLYINNLSFSFDLKIFLLTISRVLKGDGVQEGMQLEQKPTKSTEAL
ncbi:sugar transferase [Bacillus sp. Y1]|nr:sugar transferase [Bacillus sp. Y1]AYA78057.1 sugar transferase [Bacillus sp. Y1]